MDQFSGDKMFLHADRLAAWQKGELLAPVTVEMDLTNVCNHACPSCTFSYLINKSKEEIPYELAKKVIGELAEIGVKAITFSGGGEPLVYGQDRVEELTYLVWKLGMDAALITNGSKLTDKRFLGTCQWIRVSLDSYDEETFAKYHGRGKGFHEVCDNIKSMCIASAERKRVGLPCATLGVGFLTEPESYEGVYKMSEFCAREFPGLDYLQFRPLVKNMVDDPTLQGGGWGGFDKIYFDAVCAHAKIDFERHDFKILFSTGKYEALATKRFGKTYSACHAHFLESVISADCKVYRCCHGQGLEDWCIGDLREQSFSEIWHGERNKEVLEKINPMKHCPPACRLHQQNKKLESLLVPVTHKNFI